MFCTVLQARPASLTKSPTEYPKEMMINTDEAAYAPACTGSGTRKSSSGLGVGINQNACVKLQKASRPVGSGRGFSWVVSSD